MRANSAETSRLFALGVGSAASTELVDGVAAAGKGTADYATYGEALGRKVVALLKRATAKALYDVILSAKSGGAAPQQVLQLPSTLPPAFADRRYYAYVLMDTLPDQVEVSFTLSSGEPVTQLLSAQVTRGSALHQLAVKHALREWEEGGLQLQNPDPLAVREGLGREQVVQLSKQFGVACKETSWVLKGTEGHEGSLLTLQVPLPAPAESELFGFTSGTIKDLRFN